MGSIVHDHHGSEHGTDRQGIVVEQYSKLTCGDNKYETERKAEKANWKLGETSKP